MGSTVLNLSLSPIDRLLDGRIAIADALTWPETRQSIAALVARGLQQKGDLENRFGAHLADLLDDQA